MGVGFPDYYEEKAKRTPLVVLGCHDFAALLGTPGELAWPQANLAFFLPMTLDEATTFMRILVRVRGPSGNMDAGIYDTLGNKIVSMGSTAVPVATSTTSLDIADTLISAGRYYLALVCDSVAPLSLASALVSPGVNMILGVREMAAAFPLPALAVMVDNTTRGYIPILGATLQP